MYAVVRTGSKQLRVQANDVIKVEKLQGEKGNIIKLNDVLMVGHDDSNVVVGTPKVEGAFVEAEILDQTRDKKIIVFKKKRRQQYRRKKGHRQYVTFLRVKDICVA